MDLFDKLDTLEKTPTSLLTDRTPAKDINVSELLGHTSGGDFTPLQPGAANPGMATPGLNQPDGPQRMNVGNLLTPDMAASFFNIIIPTVLVLVFQKTTKQLCHKSQFEATPKEIEILKPVLSKYLESVNFTVETPFTALIITVGFIYGSKALEVINNVPKGTVKTADFKAPIAAVSMPENKVRKARPKGMTYSKKTKTVESTL